MLIYSETLEEHLALLNKVMARLRKFSFYCKLKKCNFLQPNTTFLGFDISGEGMSISDSKIKSCTDWPVPAT